MSFIWYGVREYKPTRTMKKSFLLMILGIVLGMKISFSQTTSVPNLIQVMKTTDSINLSLVQRILILDKQIISLTGKIQNLKPQVKRGVVTSDYLQALNNGLQGAKAERERIVFDYKIAILNMTAILSQVQRLDSVDQAFLLSYKGLQYSAIILEDQMSSMRSLPTIESLEFSFRESFNKWQKKQKKKRKQGNLNTTALDKIAVVFHFG